MKFIKTVAIIFSLLFFHQAFSGSIAKFSSDALANAQKSGKKIVIQYHADWCPTCAKQLASLEILIDDPKYKNVIFLQVNFDKESELKRRFNVTAQSTLLFLKGDIEILRSQGVSDKKKLSEQIEKLLAK